MRSRLPLGKGRLSCCTGSLALQVALGLPGSLPAPGHTHLAGARAAADSHSSAAGSRADVAFMVGRDGGRVAPRPVWASAPNHSRTDWHIPHRAMPNLAQPWGAGGESAGPQGRGGFLPMQRSSCSRGAGLPSCGRLQRLLPFPAWRSFIGACRNSKGRHQSSLHA